MKELSIILQKARPLGECPKADRKVPLLSLLTEAEKYIAKKYSYIAVETSEQEATTAKATAAVYFVRPIDQVPEKARILRDSSGALLGLPTVAGG
ncbi:MAG: hypothetical protein M1503_03120 [Thaumarchaeota archaeon]|nr:hypothetical protein [Nitrososphaerota archaeon]MCL5317243.1 hypothetical protein [Nitrososphaerota archaeon]